MVLEALLKQEISNPTKTFNLTIKTLIFHLFEDLLTAQIGPTSSLVKLESRAHKIQVQRYLDIQ